MFVDKREVGDIRKPKTVEKTSTGIRHPPPPWEVSLLYSECSDMEEGDPISPDFYKLSNASVFCVYAINILKLILYL